MTATNRTPRYDGSDNPTGCCPRFDPQGWDRQHLRFEEKPFAMATTRSLFHVPLNMGPVFGRTFGAIEAAGIAPDGQFAVLSRDVTPWLAEHLFAVKGPAPGLHIVHLNGDFYTRVFEGPFKDAPKWERALADEVEKESRDVRRTYFFYTTCPKCAKVYGRNYVVAFAELEPREVGDFPA